MALPANHRTRRGTRPVIPSTRQYASPSPAYIEHATGMCEERRRSAEGEHVETHHRPLSFRFVPTEKMRVFAIPPGSVSVFASRGKKRRVVACERGRWSYIDEHTSPISVTRLTLPSSKPCPNRRDGCPLRDEHHPHWHQGQREEQDSVEIPARRAGRYVIAQQRCLREAAEQAAAASQ